MQIRMGHLRLHPIDRTRDARHSRRMSRRQFLHALSGAATFALGGGCSPATPMAAAPADAAQPAGPRRKIRGICFDLFTLFDPRSVVAVARAIVGEAGPALCETWRVRQFEYAWLRAAAGRYADFRVVTDEALVHAAASRAVVLGQAERARLVDAYSELAPWPDAADALRRWRTAGLKLAPLANYAPGMLEALVAHAGFDDLFDALISTDRATTFKPDPRAYALGPSVLGLDKEEIAFSAFGGWDAAGARWFGFPTFWVNRLGVTPEVLPPGADATGPDLQGLAAFIARWS